MLERRTQRIQPYLLLVPSLLILTVFLLFPLLWNVYLSVHNVSLSTILRDWKYVGPKNFLDLLTDPSFRSSLKVSILFVGGSVTLQFFFGLVLAVVLNQLVRGSNTLRALIIIPWTVSAVITGFSFKFIFNDSFGILNYGQFATIINNIAGSGAEIVFSDLVGDSIVAFYKQFKQFGLTPEDLPICTPITTEQETAAMGPENAAGHYTSFNYFQSVDTPENKAFVERYKAKYGKNQVTNAVMEAAYFQTYLLAQAIEKVGNTDTDALIYEGLPGQEFKAPQGPVKIDEKNHHTWLWARIGKARDDGQFDIVWTSQDRIRPDPWVDYLYPHKDCDFTNKAVTDRLKNPWSAEKNRSGTMDM